MMMNDDCEMGVSRIKPQTCPSTSKFCDYVKIKVEAMLGKVPANNIFKFQSDINKSVSFQPDLSGLR